MAENSRVLPRSTALSEPYWAGCRRGELRIQHCQACNRYQFYPRVMCSACGSDSISWQTVSGHGSVGSFTVVRRGVSSAYEAPYIVALIDLAEGPRLMSQIVDLDPADPSLQVGAQVRVAFRSWSDEISLPVFKILPAEG